MKTGARDQKRQLNQWTEDGQPLCNHCHGKGHIRICCPKLKPKGKPKDTSAFCGMLTVQADGAPEVADLQNEVAQLTVQNERLQKWLEHGYLCTDLSQFRYVQGGKGVVLLLAMTP